MNRFRVSHLSALLALLAVVYASSVGIAQVKQGKARPAKTGALMKGIVKPHCTDLKKALDSTPATDEAWDAITTHAAILNEISYSLMEDGRCPDGVWADSTTKQLRAGSADLLKAAEAKDLAAAKKAFGSIGASCNKPHDSPGRRP
jgi:cytochrome c556